MHGLFGNLIVPCCLTETFVSATWTARTPNSGSKFSLKATPVVVSQDKSSPRFRCWCFKNILSFKPRCLEIPIDFCYDLISGFLGQNFSLYPPELCFELYKKHLTNWQSEPACLNVMFVNWVFFIFHLPPLPGKKTCVCVCVYDITILQNQHVRNGAL